MGQKVSFSTLNFFLATGFVAGTRSAETNFGLENYIKLYALNDESALLIVLEKMLIPMALVVYFRELLKGIIAGKIF